MMTKMKMRMKKLGRMNLIFEFSILKLGYMAIFMKICGKKIDLFFKTLLTNRGKNENVNEEIWKNKFDLWKLGYMAIFMKICGKKNLTHILGHFWLIEAKMKMKIKNMGKWIQFLNSAYQIRLCDSFHENLRKIFLTHFLRHFWLIGAKMKM